MTPKTRGEFCSYRNLTFFIPKNTLPLFFKQCLGGKSNDFRFFANVHLFGVSWHCFLSLSWVKKLKSVKPPAWESTVLVAFSYVSLASKAQKSSIFKGAFCILVQQQRCCRSFKICKLKENAFVLVCCNLHLSCVVLLVTRCYCIVHQRPHSV